MKPLNALIAEVLGWRTWSRPGNDSEWFQERDSEPGKIEVGPVYDYIPHLRHLHHRHRHRVVLVVDGVGIRLTPNEKEHVMLNVTVGHKVNCSFHIVDADGNPMKVQPPLDASPAPAWTNTPSSPPVDAFTVSPDGSAAVLAASAAGADSIALSVSVGGVVFTASVAVTISDKPQVASGVVIDTEVV